MPYSYDLDSPVGQVRLLISDIPSGDPTSAVFTDEEVEAFLSMRDGNPRLAAATALRTLGGNAVMVRGRLTMLDARTDAPAEAQALADLADRYEREVDEAGLMDVAGGQPSPSGRRGRFTIL